MIKRGFDFWDVVMLFGAMLILFWATLKSLGIIHSPIWIEMMPYFGIGITLVGAIYKMGKIARGVEETENKVKDLIIVCERFKKVENEHNLLIDGKLKIKH